MCTPCKSCKLRDEDMYRNLDNEKKHFLVLMMGDFQDAMIVPEELLRRFKGEIPEEIKLETRKGDSHTIVVARNQQKLVFTVGWSQFVEIYDLHMGDSIILNYKGKSKFDVKIFDNLGREKALSAILDPYIFQVQNRVSNGDEIGSAKNMDAPCGRCNSWLEYHYMNLDDEKKYWLILMMGDFQNEMIIPEEFVKRFKGEIPGEIILETQNRHIYIIGVAKHQEKLVLTAGWGTFVQTFGLQMGDTIVFKYSGNSKFPVIIFDKLGCENALSVIVSPPLAPVQQRRTTNATETVTRSNIHPQPVQMPSNIEAVDRAMQVQSPVESMKNSHLPPQSMEIQPSTSTLNGTPMESPPTERQRRPQMDKSCQGNMPLINISSSDSYEDSFSSEDDYGVHDVSASNYIPRKKSRLSASLKEQLKDGYIIARKTKLTSVQMEAVKQKVHSIGSDIPIVVAVMYKSNVDSDFVFTFPSHYAKKYLSGEPHMNLQLRGEKYAVRFIETLHCTRLKTGWKKFAQDNNLKLGDICLFELLSNQRRTMEVYIIRANEDN